MLRAGAVQVGVGLGFSTTADTRAADLHTFASCAAPRDV